MDAASRAFEAQADYTALEATGDPEALRGVVSRTAQLNLQQPHGPWIWRMLASHPSAAERAALADAWEARNS
jgi:Zn-dependent protease with chaperone function